MSLQTDRLSFTYDGQHWIRFPDVHLDAGEKCLVLGQSGTGKTTFLHLVAGLLKPSEGTVTIDDTVLNKLSARSLDRFRGQKIGLVFQQPHFIRSLDVLENLKLAQYLAGRREDTTRARHVLAMLNLEHKEGAHIQTLSQGEKQRVAIARALINLPSMILADEPTSALDDANCNEVLSLLEQASKEVKATLVIVTHDGRLKDRFKKQIQIA